MSSASLPGGHVGGFLETHRVDRWWSGPAATLFGLLAFIVYSTYAAFSGSNYWFSGGVEGFGGYLSPFYSPVVFQAVDTVGGVPDNHILLGNWPAWLPDFIPASPALIILAFPLSFRFTCYYYRKAYYRAFSGTPAGCAVGPVPQKNYKGETGLLLIQNLHRYALIFALLLIPILTYDSVLSFFRGGEFGIGVGSVVITLNTIFLSSYTLGCHSFRHLVGGKMDCFSCSKGAQLRQSAWKKSSFLNRYHMQFAWLSLIWVGFSDLYVRLVSMGVWTDLSTWS